MAEETSPWYRRAKDRVTRKDSDPILFLPHRKHMLTCAREG